MLRQQRSRINALPVAVKALPEEEMHSVRNGLDNLKVGCRVGREVTRPGPSPDPDEEISSIRLFRRCGSWLHRLHYLHKSR
jgi:hypothetical protein